ncbi:hypothetical protein GCM10028815_14930 [Mariniluteicoccus flavus]
MPPTSPSSDVAAFTGQLRAYAASRGVPLGVVVLPIGGQPVEAGTWSTGVAWSTSKVPLVVASARQDPAAPATVREAAIVRSDNAAAMRLWESLGTPDQAAARVDAVAAAYGAPIQTQRRVVRAGFSPFGQTEWSTAGQARFMAGLACDSSPAAVATKELMGRISPDHRWGLGRLPGARFKGGWGPTTTGSQLVRQMGVVDLGSGQVAIAIATEAGTEAGARAELDAVAGWLADHGRGLRAPGCPR